MPKVTTNQISQEVIIEHGQAIINATIFSNGTVSMEPRKGNMFQFKFSDIELVSDITQCFIKALELAKDLKKEFAQYSDEEAKNNAGK